MIYIIINHTAPVVFQCANCHFQERVYIEKESNNRSMVSYLLNELIVLRNLSQIYICSKKKKRQLGNNLGLMNDNKSKIYKKQNRRTDLEN